MQQLSCPIPQNINPLQSNGFMFAINKLPTVSFFCQEANLPSLSLPPANMPTPLSDSPLPGDKLEFGTLDITFLIDEDMVNYIAVHSWMVGLGFPKSHEQYKAYIREQTTQLSELMMGYSDGVLQILNSSNNAIRTVTFRDMFPTSLGSIQMQSTSSDTTYLAAQASFLYTYYEFT